jgi:hypothetical protein
MTARLRTLALALSLAASAARPALATPPAYVGGQFRYWVFDDGNNMRDVLAYFARPTWHVQLEYWDWEDPNARNQFRPEVGIHLRDFRRSVYTIQWRHEGDYERFTFGTDQVLNGHFVGRAYVSPLVSGQAGTLWVEGFGADYYWGSYNFASSTLIHDARGGGLWSMPLRLRLATEGDDWIQFALVPASQRSMGGAVDVKWRGIRAGVEVNSRYDFTNRDNVIYTIGYERALGVKP